MCLSAARKNTNVLNTNNSARNGSLDIHLGLWKTLATTRKVGKPLSLVDLARKERRQTDKDRNKGNIS